MVKAFRGSPRDSNSNPHHTRFLRRVGTGAFTFSFRRMVATPRAAGVGVFFIINNSDNARRFNPNFLNKKPYFQIQHIAHDSVTMLNN
ncbi:hypothetical protein YC2023_083051 [Brassica napus]